jgi:hypothetical protein
MNPKLTTRLYLLKLNNLYNVHIIPTVGRPDHFCFVSMEPVVWFGKQYGVISFFYKYYC